MAAHTLEFENIKIDWISHVSFVRVQGIYRPWIVTMIPVSQPLRAFTIALSSEGLNFTNEDIKCNLLDKLEEFPRTEDFKASVQIDHRADFESEFREKLRWTGGLIIAVDVSTYDFLCRVFENKFVQLQAGLLKKSFEKTSAVALKHQKEEKMFSYAVRVSFVRENNILRPWLVTITSIIPYVETFTIGLSGRGLVYTDDDVEKNILNELENYPRNKNLSHEIYACDNFESGLREIYMEHFWKDGWIEQMIAVDQTSYDYLIKVFGEEFGIKMWTNYLTGADEAKAIAHELIYKNTINA